MLLPYEYNMQKNKRLWLGSVIILGAWIVGLPGIFLFYDFLRPLHLSIVMSYDFLRPYSAWIGLMPSVLFFVGTLIGFIILLKPIKEPTPSELLNSFIKIVKLLGLFGMIISSSPVQFIAYLLFAYFARLVFF